MFFDVEGAARSAAVWPDAIPSLLPKVDYLLVGRKVLAPKRFFLRRPDVVPVAWDDLEPLLREHSSNLESRGLFLNYQALPAALAERVRSLPPHSQLPVGIHADAVLNAELVADSGGKGE